MGNYELSTTIENLTKTYLNCCKKNVRAVDHLYLGLEPKEKFGLLGFNGSGKTTTFKAITNQIFFDEGEITIFGYNTKTNFENIRNRIGFCPQENPLFDYLTVRETLNYYKSLKQSNLDVNVICEKFGISSYIDKYTTVLSGGNKRKLVFAIALMNRPSFLLLDEPSSGVDPKSRRLMWKNINELSKNVDEFNMILTTHSIEEAEVLCDTVSWLKNGNFKCVGNPEKLKLMYSSGYKLHIKFNDEEAKKIVIQNNQQEIVNDCIKLNIIDLHLCNAFFSDINFIKYFYHFYQFLNKIVNKCTNIKLNEVGNDYSFRLTLYIKKESQSQLFSDILNMKNENNLISETNIKIEPLENILTSL
jgi:ABC-type multidrug transport system ATPase subunit